MMNELLKQWIKERGLKSYALPILIGLILDIAVIVNYGSLVTSGYGALHITMVIILHIALIGYNIGMGVHMVSGYRKWKKREEEK